MDIKQKIMGVTIDLIRETNGNTAKITIREIAKRADIGIGLINYHFQSKTHLIDLCVQQIISGVIAQSNPDTEQLLPIEKLKRSVKIPVDFLADNCEISKISILNDLVQGQENDNTFKTLARFYFYASKLEQDEDTFFKAAFLIHGLQGIFLRSRLYKDKFDFYDKAQRDNLIDNVVEKLFGGEK